MVIFELIVIFAFSMSILYKLVMLNLGAAAGLSKQPIVLDLFFLKIGHSFMIADYGQAVLQSLSFSRAARADLS